MTATRFVLAAALAIAATPAFAMDLKSTDVAQGALFPANEICARYGGGDVSPALTWSGVPANAKSLAVTMFDPDASGAGWWHWLVVDIPPSATGLTQGAGSDKLPEGARHLDNSNGNASYHGPCPPAGSGVHHYHITLWALRDAKAPLDASIKPADAGAWLKQHAVAQAELTPVYQK